MTSLYSSGPPHCPSNEPQTPTWPPPGVSQTPTETPQPALTTKPQAASTGTPKSLKPLSRSTLDPRCAQGSGLEWALPALLFKSAGERRNNNNKKGAAERRGPAVTNAVTQAPLPPQVLISLAPPAEPPHHSQTGDTASPRPAVLGISSRNAPAAGPRRCPAAPARGSFLTGAVAVLSPCSGHRPAGFGVSVATRVWLCGQPWLSAWRQRSGSGSAFRAGPRLQRPAVTPRALRSGVKRAAVPEECAAVSRSRGGGGVAGAAGQQFGVTVP